LEDELKRLKEYNLEVSDNKLPVTGIKNFKVYNIAIKMLT